MRVAHIVVPGASEYERKHARIDATDAVATDEAELVHLYAPQEFPASTILDLKVPYVASGVPRKRWLRRVIQPRIVITPENVPEAVEDGWFETLWSAGALARAVAREKRAGEGTRAPQKYVIASFGRPSVKNATEQAIARIHRFRDDIEWHVFGSAPQPHDLSGVDVWVDPAGGDEDLDGFVAEALVAGLPVVATRTKINLRRTEKGINAFLVPANDANELTHAILAALFKSEVAEVKIEGARRTASKFRSRQRRRVLDRIYEQALGS